MSIFISTDTIKVAGPGVNAQTVGEKDLLLSIGQRTGQILQRGVLSISGGSGSASIGPFSQAPEVIGWGRNVGGYAHYPACMVTDTQASAGPVQVAETFICTAMSVTNSNISVTGYAQTTIPGTPDFNGFAYIIYRKPNRG